MQPMSTQTRFIITVVALLLLGVGAYYFIVSPKSVQAPTDTASSTGTPSATTTPTQNPDEGKIVLNTPNYKKAIAFSANIEASFRDSLNEKLKTIIAQLNANQLDIRAWINLGAIRKMGGDYAGAAEAWEYILSILPANTTAAYNLGDLYQNFTHENAKAEARFLLVIEHQPTNVNPYVNLYQLYRFAMKDNVKAAAILEQGLKVIPGNEQLLSLKADLAAGK